MPNTIRFAFILHDHQPVGNFDNVFEQAYQDSYKLFLDLFERYPHLKIGLHTSGPLMEWLDIHHPDYLDRLAGHVSTGRIEIIGGAYYEPILAMIPSRDRVGQIRSYSNWLENRLGGEVRGMWIPERVWEQSMTSDLVAAGIQYTLLDDFHFKNAGLHEDQLHGYYMTEDNGNTLAVFPDSEPLRYIIPFGQPHQVIEYLGRVAEQHPNAVCVFGDDGEKFGVWPETKKTVFDEGWLVRLFDMLAENQHWIKMVTLAETVDSVTPLGKVYLPEGSYREMTEWVLPPEQLSSYEETRANLKRDNRWDAISRFARGGYWRNFKVRYPETNEMYARMMMISRRLDETTRDGEDEHPGARGDLLKRARTELYRGQCNCSYWHGAFGGIYLPHLRNAIFTHLIAAENLLDRAAGRSEPWVEATASDYNFDARQEIFLASDKLAAMIAPSRGGHIYELDVRAIATNLLATLARRPEAYHRRVLAGPNGAGGSVIDANAPVIFKQAGLDQRIQYDTYQRKSLHDHFFDNDATLQSVAAEKSLERGDFVHGAYETKVRRNPSRIQVQMTRAGNAWGVPLRITKGITMEAGHSSLEVAYMIEGLPPEATMHFAVEFNFAAMPSGADDRFFYGAEGKRLGQLGERLDLRDVSELNLVDQWLGIDVGLSASRETNFWTFPIETVSQSEGGFELVHQSVCVMPHWFVRGDADGRWSVTMRLALDTTLAESRVDKPNVLATISSL